MPYGIINVGDLVTIKCPDDGFLGDYCEHCDDTIGYDEYDMCEYDGQTVEVEKVFQRTENSWTSPKCGAQTFEHDGWIWTTCWISAHHPQCANSPNWEV